MHYRFFLQLGTKSYMKPAVVDNMQSDNMISCKYFTPLVRSEDFVLVQRGSHDLTYSAIYSTLKIGNLKVK